MVVIKSISLTLFFLMELASLVIFGWWGFHMPGGWGIRTLLGSGTPLAAALFWGQFLSPRARLPLSKGLRNVLKMVFFSFAVWALNYLGEGAFSVAFTLLAIIEIVLVNLLKLEAPSTKAN